MNIPKLKNANCATPIPHHHMTRGGREGKNRGKFTLSQQIIPQFFWQMCVTKPHKKRNHTPKKKV
jgi:hypothetical protein